MNETRGSLDKYGALRALFFDGAPQAADLLNCIKSNCFSEHQLVYEWIKQFGGVNGFADVFQTWVDEQLQSTLYQRKVTTTTDVTESMQGGDRIDTAVHPPVVEIDSNPILSTARNEEAGPGQGALDGRERDSEMMLRVLGQTMHVKQKKPKKRLVPTQVATAPVVVDQSTSQTCKSFASDNTPHSVVGTRSQPFMSYDGPVPPPDMSVNSGDKSFRDKAPDREVSTLSPTFLSNHRRNTSTSCDDTASSGEVVSVAEVRVLIDVAATYASLVVHLYIPFSSAIPFLAKLLSVAVDQPMNQSGFSSQRNIFITATHIHVFAAKCVEFCLPLFGHLGPHITMELTNSPVLQSYCSESVMLLRSLADDSYLERELRSGAGASNNGTDVSGNIGGLDMFIRPFHADVDDRNLYKTQSESAIYNERERLYDDMSDLYRKYQEICSSDLDGSKMEEFWRYMSRACSRIIPSIRDINLSWFADLIMQMLLHYGSNLSNSPIERPEKSSKNSNENASTESKKGFSVQSKLKSSGATKQRLLEARMGPGGIGQSSGFGRAPNKVIRPSSSSAAIPAGGRGQQNVPLGSVQPQTNPVSHKTNHSGGGRNMNVTTASAINSNILSQPAVLFPGNQQFFFRFIVQCDCYRLLRHLEISVWNEIVNLENFSIKSSTHGDFFSLTLFKLGMLGRFLGLLYFSPFWILSISTDSLGSGPLLHTSERLLELRKVYSAFNPSGAINLLELVKRSVREKRFCLTVVWVTEYLKLMTWDGVMRLTCGGLLTASRSDSERGRKGSTVTTGFQEQLSCLQYLIALLFADRRIFEREEMSSNRVFILIVLEAFVSSLPRELRHIDRKSFAEVVRSGGLLGIEQGHITAGFRDLTSNSPLYSVVNLDEKNFAFSEQSFSDRLVPFVSVAAKLLRYVKMPALSRSRSSSTSSAACSGHVITPRALKAISSTTSILSHNVASIAPKESQSDDMSTSLPGEVEMPPTLRTTDLSILHDVSRALFSNSPQRESEHKDRDSRKPVPEPLGLIPHAIPLKTNLYSTIDDARAVSSSPPSSNLEVYHQNIPDDAYRSIGMSPDALAGVINNNYFGNLHSNCALPPTPTSSTQQSTLVLTPSLSRQLSSTGKASSLGIRGGKSMYKRLQQRLEVAFWRQHENLFQISRFFIDQLTQGLKMHVKEIMVADAIHRTWEIADREKKNISTSFATALVDLVPLEDLGSAIDNIKSSFRTTLKGKSIDVHRDTMRKAAIHTENAIDQLITTSFPQILRLYPSSERVVALTVHLMKGQVDVEIRKLLSYMDSFAMRKLDDVVRVSSDQLARQLEKKKDFLTAQRKTVFPVSSKDYVDSSRLSGESIGNSECPDTSKAFIIDTNKHILEHISYSQKKLAFSTLLDKICQVACCRSTSNSVEISRLTWETLQEENYSYELRDEFEKNLCTINMHKVQNNVNWISERIAELLTSSCEILMYECSLTESFVNSVRVLAYCEEHMDCQGDKFVHVVIDRNASSILESDFEKEKDPLYENVQKTIGNLISLCSVLLGGLQLLKKPYQSSSSDDAHVSAHFHIEVMKCFALCCPTLLYLDALLLGSLSGSSTIGVLMWPSDILLSSIQFGFIDNLALCRVIFGSGKQAQISYHESWRQYLYFKDIFPPFSLFLFARYYFSVKFGASEDNLYNIKRLCDWKKGRDKLDYIPLLELRSLFDADFAPALCKLFPPSVCKNAD